MKNKKEYCQDLYNRYKELKRKTELEVHNVKPGGKIEAKHIDIKDMEEKIKVEEKLHDCLSLLTGKQLGELYGDPDFMEKAAKILADRKINN
jgi:hypothetical protein